MKKEEREAELQRARGPFGKELDEKSQLSDYWITREVAQYLDIQPSTLSSYVARRQFPEPDMKVGREPLWEIRKVHEWAAQRPRRPR